MLAAAATSVSGDPMARKLKGFAAAGVVAGFSETGEVGEWNDINAPRNAPAKSPLQHLDKVALHSSFYLYEVAYDGLITVNHAAIPSDTVFQGFTSVGLVPLGITWRGRVQEASHVLVNHGLPYTPLCMVSYDGAMIVSGTIVQTEFRGTRFISLKADGTSVGLGECGYANEESLPGVSRTYRVVIFKTPAPDAGSALFSGGSAGFQIGRGMVDSSARFLRAADSSSNLDMDLDRTIDIGTGGARVVTGGNVQTDRYYSGSFAGGGFVPVDV